jgi:hypothetical protein
MESEKQALEEKQRLTHEGALVRRAHEQELAEEEMRVKLERLAHTVGLAHRPEDSKLGGGVFGEEEDAGWTPESILASLQVRVLGDAKSSLRACWVTLRACWVTLRARWVTLRARWVTLRELAG